MDAKDCLKSIIISASYYCQNQTESNASQLLRHVEVLLAVLKPKEVAQLFNFKNELGTEFLKSVLQVVICHNQDGNIVNKIFKVLSIIAGEQLACRYLYESFNLCEVLCTYVVQHYGNSFRSANILQCFKLFEKLSYGQNVSSLTTNIDKFITCLFEEIKKNGDCFTVCIEVTVNLVTNNVAIQAQVKGIMDRMKIRKKLLEYLKTSNSRNKLNILAFMTICCWDDKVTRKLWSDFRNVTQTLSLLIAELFDFSDPDGYSQRRAADLCLELLKHDDVAEQFAIYESEKNILLRLLEMLKDKVACKASEKLLEVMLGFCRTGFVRRKICEKVFESQEKLEILLDFISSPVTRNTGPSSILALDFIQELCEDAIDCGQDIKEAEWLESILTVLFGQLTPNVPDDNPDMSEIYLEIATERTFKSLQILSVLAGEDDLKSVVASGLDVATLSQVINHQLTHNLTGISHTSQPKWSDIGVDVVLCSLQFADKLKSDLPDLEELFYTTLQDSRLVPIMATAISSQNQKRVYAALRLHQEALPLPEYLSLSLSESIANLNSKKTQVDNIAEYTRCEVVKSVLQPSIKQERINISSSSHLSDEGKENIQSLIAKIHSMDEDVQSDDVKSRKTPEMFDIFEQRISSLITKENHLQDLLEAKTLALAQADRLISKSRTQKSKSEEDMRRIVNMLKQAVSKNEDMCEEMKVLDSDKQLQERELHIMIEKNGDLKMIAEQFECLLPDYNDKKHKISVLERNLQTSHAEYDTLKDIHEMIQKHNDKLKVQLNEAVRKLEILEEERIDHHKKFSELERKGADLTQLVEEQDRSYKSLLQEKTEQDTNVKNLNLHVKKKEEELKIKVISYVKLKKEYEHKEKKHEIEKEDLKKLLEEKQEEANRVREKLDKQAQTLAMITGLCNNPRGSQN